MTNKVMIEYIEITQNTQILKNAVFQVKIFGYRLIVSKVADTLFYSKGIVWIRKGAAAQLQKSPKYKTQENKKQNM